MPAGRQGAERMGPGGRRSEVSFQSLNYVLWDLIMDRAHFAMMELVIYQVQLLYCYIVTK